MAQSKPVWVDLYEEIADKLLEYRGDRPALLELWKTAHERADVNFASYKDDENGTPLNDVCPFTFFGSFNKHPQHPDKRIRLLKELKQNLRCKAEVPTDFEGIPLINAQKSMYFGFAGNRDSGDIENLWNIFEVALKYSKEPDSIRLEKSFVELYDSAIKQKYVKFNLSMGLFWIRPSTFLALDGNNRQYLLGVPYIGQMLNGQRILENLKKGNVLSGAEYLLLLESCREYVRSNTEITNFIALSHQAYEKASSGKTNQQKSKVPVYTSMPEPGEGEEPTMQLQLNTIYYGPPGTGKTYKTVQHAVAVVEQKSMQAIQAEAYTAVHARYRAYMEQGLVEFVTFHQSYGYEEFVEGIRPLVVEAGEEEEAGGIAYTVADGAFTDFCRKSQTQQMIGENEFGLNESPAIWKVSLYGTGDNPIRSDCMDNGYIRIGWDNYGAVVTDDTKFVDGGKRVLNAFINNMRVGDIVMSCYSGRTIDAIGVITGEYVWDEKFDYMRRTRKVNWLVKNINEDIYALNKNTALTLSTVYRLNNISLASVLQLLQKYQPRRESKEQNKVFIIDEINRGNVAKIFGELITLIEPCKREGAKEQAEVKLPYSGTAFSIPRNIYIVGTMNTADRSIAIMDAALRRRFSFEELMPQPELLDGVEVGGVSIKELMEKLNLRISALYDREHTLGHAYFLPLKKEPTIHKLAQIFRYEIIPLLQEYFVDDWEKVRLVLGDTKKTEAQQFLVRREAAMQDLLAAAELDGYFEARPLYSLNHAALTDLAAYQLI